MKRGHCIFLFLCLISYIVFVMGASRAADSGEFDITNKQIDKFGRPILLEGTVNSEYVKIEYNYLKEPDVDPDNIAPGYNELYAQITITVTKNGLTRKAIFKSNREGTFFSENYGTTLPDAYMNRRYGFVNGNHLIRYEQNPISTFIKEEDESGINLKETFILQIPGENQIISFQNILILD